MKISLTFVCNVVIRIVVFRCLNPSQDHWNGQNTLLRSNYWKSMRKNHFWRVKILTFFISNVCNVVIMIVVFRCHDTPSERAPFVRRLCKQHLNHHRRIILLLIIITNAFQFSSSNGFDHFHKYGHPAACYNNHVSVWALDSLCRQSSYFVKIIGIPNRCFTKKSFAWGRLCWIISMMRRYAVPYGR